MGGVEAKRLGSVPFVVLFSHKPGPIVRCPGIAFIGVKPHGLDDLVALSF